MHSASFHKSASEIAFRRHGTNSMSGVILVESLYGGVNLNPTSKTMLAQINFH